jgi:hypothetical protein
MITYYLALIVLSIVLVLVIIENQFQVGMVMEK